MRERNSCHWGLTPVLYGGQTPMTTQQRPAAGNEAGPARRMLGGREPAFRVDQRTQILEPIGGDEARRRELPQAVFNDARELTRVLDHIGQKRRAAAVE
jgi:hypothetical protein